MAGPRVPMPTVCAPTAMVASADALASRAGLDIMARGGSAVDGAIATNAVLAVTAPHLCGMGGDLFALVHDGSPTPAVLNASGRAGSGADADRLRSEGHHVMPFRHDIRTVTVPGCVDGWLTLHERYGRLDLTDVFAAAIGYAEGGFPASPLLAASVARLDVAPPADYASVRTAGDRLRRPGAGRTLRTIAADGRAGFYGGEFGAGLVGLGAGYFVAADLERSQADWVDPLYVDAFGHRIWTVPPNSQGYLTLASAWIADGLPLPDDPDDGLWAHLLAEAAVQAGFDRPAVLADDADGTPWWTRAPPPAPRRSRESISNRWVGAARVTSLCAVDGDGMGVSLISQRVGFRQLLFEPATGSTSTTAELASRVRPSGQYAPGRRPPHPVRPSSPMTARCGRARRRAATVSPSCSCRCWPGCYRPTSDGEAIVPFRAQGRPGFDTWIIGADRSRRGDNAPTPGSGLRRRGHDVTVRPPSSIRSAMPISSSPILAAR